jgi:RNA polymerase sigma factor (sigma-70 family)
MVDLQRRSAQNFALLLLKVLARRKPVADLISHPEFLKRSKGICNSLARGTSYNPEDMFQDLCVKMLNYGVMLLPRNIPDEGAFFRWLLVVARNLLNDYFRKNGKRLRREVSLGDILPEALEIADPGRGPERDCLLEEFELFLRALPDRTRRAIALRGEGLTYDDIGDEIGCSNVTARKIIRDAYAEFFGYKAAAKKVV